MCFAAEAVLCSLSRDPGPRFLEGFEAHPMQCSSLSLPFIRQAHISLSYSSGCEGPPDLHSPLPPGQGHPGSLVASAAPGGHGDKGTPEEGLGKGRWAAGEHAAWTRAALLPRAAPVAMVSSTQTLELLLPFSLGGWRFGRVFVPLCHGPCPAPSWCWAEQRFGAVC